MTLNIVFSVVLTKYSYLFTCHWPPIGYLEVKGELGFAASLDFKRSIFLCMVSIFFLYMCQRVIGPVSSETFGIGMMAVGGN